MIKNRIVIVNKIGKIESLNWKEPLEDGILEAKMVRMKKVDNKNSRKK